MVLNEELKTRSSLAGQLVARMIQKFRNEPGQPYPMLSDRSDVIVITDEAHRSQYDIFALNMRNALPKAGFIGFTGTPLIDGEEERTREVFGDYVSVYDFAQSIEEFGRSATLMTNLRRLEVERQSLVDEQQDIQSHPQAPIVAPSAAEVRQRVSAALLSLIHI